MADLKGKVVIVTGASSGIGASLARAFSARGARVSLAARREGRLRDVARSCPGEALVIESDLLEEADRAKIVRETLKKWGSIDILVNNAGMGSYGDFMSFRREDWREIFEINVFSTVFLTQTVLETMKKQGRGLIVNIASIGGLLAHSDKVTPYVASKHAVVGFSRGLAKDLEGSPVRVIAVCPHLTDTDFFSVSQGAEEMAPEVERIRDYMDSPDDVAKGIIEQLDSGQLIVFPTAKPAKAYEKLKDI